MSIQRTTTPATFSCGQTTSGWLLSYNLCPEVLELYQQPGIFIEQVDRINNMAQRYEGGAVYQEVLISNYDTRKSAQAQLHLFEPAAEERKILWNGLY